MRELYITTRSIQTESNRPMKLQYAVLVEETPSGLENYGIQITEAEVGSFASAPGLTVSSQRICELTETLARNTVTPVALMDVLDDWL